MAEDARFVAKVSYEKADMIKIVFADEVDEVWAKDTKNFKVYQKINPDIVLPIRQVEVLQDKKTILVKMEQELNKNEVHIVSMKTVKLKGKDLGPANITVKKFYFGHLFSIFFGAMLVNNFVFTKYLGLCVFFGTSRKRSTAIGMGITFTIVMVFSAMMSWFLYQFVLKPFNLNFLQVVVFIGMVSLSVQAVDTILRKVNPVLFKAFGVYLVLVIANCIIIAVPLILADNEYNAIESFMLALGAGLGFLVALFLMSSVRERLELALVPQSFRGLPIAFVTAGLFALAFMGFSGMSIF
jgi:electron transport complex protein RnfA